ncbi:DivIVA domain-containing protein [Kineococcus gynurae]|uniref:Cell wall synthesis protein Wag31 n=1 Tax=Kineococcus gynurae TaxID=452979 RepID=A0ABV5LXV4_9ACTN
MTLTPEDVVNKRFNPTRVREGYAQDEVDDFLDEVVAELRRLNAENAELRDRLEQGGPSAAPAAAAPAPVELEKPATAAPAPAASETAPAEQAAGIIALAQQLHDQYVHDGESQRDALVASARTEAERLVGEAETARDRTLGELDSRRMSLEESIENLRGREADYREQLERVMTEALAQLRRSPHVVKDDAVAR